MYTVLYSRHQGYLPFTAQMNAKKIRQENQFGARAIHFPQYPKCIAKIRLRGQSFKVNNFF